MKYIFTSIVLLAFMINPGAAGAADTKCTGKESKVEKTSVTISVNTEIFQFLTQLDSDLVFFTSQSKPIECLEELSSIQEVGLWGAELGNTVWKFQDLTKLPGKGLRLIGNGHFDTLFNKNTTLRLFLTHQEYVETITRKGGGIIVKFSEMK